ncbi:MAG TPA: GNAT family N-acetyltransferase [Nitrospira sp.]|nr:GNAT family N-acetyltransferase [Nitrospira sp.]
MPNNRVAGFRIATLMDESVSHLSPAMQLALRLADTEWLNSFDFCIQYVIRPATRVRLRLDEQARVSQACFYNEDRWKWGFRKLHIFGPVRMTNEEMQELMRERDAALATVTCMGPEDLKCWSGPWHRWSSRMVNEDIIVDLPPSEDEYLLSLGHNARTQLPYYLRRVEKEWGEGFTVMTATGADISLRMFQELVEFNRVRIEHKGATHLWNAQLIEQRWKLAQECGLFVGLQYNGKLVAGTMSYLHRNEAFFILIGHEKQYDRLRLGKLALWLTIRLLIRRGHSRYHLLWGASPYKLQLGGKARMLSELTVFRHSFVASVWYADQWISRIWSTASRLMTLPAAMARKIRTAVRESFAWVRVS